MESVTLTIGVPSGPTTDLTAAVIEFCAGKGDGLLNVFAPHSTVGLALVQLDGGSGEDIEGAVHRLLPRDGAYVHIEKAPGHGADHLLPLIASPSLVIPVREGAPLLGAFQRAVLLDFDEQPSERRVVLSFLAG